MCRTYTVQCVEYDWEKRRDSQFGPQRIGFTNCVRSFAHAWQKWIKICFTWMQESWYTVDTGKSLVSRPGDLLFLNLYFAFFPLSSALKVKKGATRLTSRPVQLNWETTQQLVGSTLSSVSLLYCFFSMFFCCWNIQNVCICRAPNHYIPYIKALYVRWRPSRTQMQSTQSILNQGKPKQTHSLVGNQKEKSEAEPEPNQLQCYFWPKRLSCRCPSCLAVWGSTSIVGWDELLSGDPPWRHPLVHQRPFWSLEFGILAGAISVFWKQKKPYLSHSLCELYSPQTCRREIALLSPELSALYNSKARHLCPLISVVALNTGDRVFCSLASLQH